MLDESDQIIALANVWKSEKEPDRQKYVNQIWNIKDHITKLATTNLDNKDVVSIELFLDHEIGTFNVISRLCKNEPIVYGDDRNYIDVSPYNNLKRILPDMIISLNNQLEQK